jgi:hypothetical protein
VTAPHLTEHPAASQQAIVDAALLMLRQIGLSPDDLMTAPQDRPPVPTFAEYVPVVSAAVTDGTRRAYGSYWNRIISHWGERRLDEPTPSEVRQLMSYVKTHVVARRNARGDRSATEHLVAALRCLYKHAEDDGYITAGENPARKVDKPPPPALHPPGRHRRPPRRDLPGRRGRRRRSRTRHAGPAAAHREACRRGGALALRPDDLDPGQPHPAPGRRRLRPRRPPARPALCPHPLPHPGREPAAPRRPAHHRVRLPHQRPGAHPDRAAHPAGRARRGSRRTPRIPAARRPGRQRAPSGPPSARRRRHPRRPCSRAASTCPQPGSPGRRIIPAATPATPPGLPRPQPAPARPARPRTVPRRRRSR